MNKEPMYLNHLASVPYTPTTIQQAALWQRTQAQLRNRKRSKREHEGVPEGELIAAYALLTVPAFRARIEARILEDQSGPSLRSITPSRNLQALLLDIMLRRWLRRVDRHQSEEARTGTSPIHQANRRRLGPLQRLLKGG